MEALFICIVWLDVHYLLVLVVRVYKHYYGASTCSSTTTIPRCEGAHYNCTTLYTVCSVDCIELLQCMLEYSGNESIEYMPDYMRVCSIMAAFQSVNFCIGNLSTDSSIFIIKDVLVIKVEEFTFYRLVCMCNIYNIYSTFLYKEC